MNGHLKFARFAWLVLAALAAYSGCQRSTPAPAPRVDSIQAPDVSETVLADAGPNGVDDASAADDSVDPAETAAMDEDASDPIVEDAVAEDSIAEDAVAEDAVAEDAAAEDAAAPVEPAPVEEPATPEPPTERFALLTPGGPLIVDVIINIDGGVHLSALETLVDEAYEAADTDGDGQRTWEEVADSPKFRYGQFGNLPITNDSQKPQLISMYDRNENGLVDRNELPRFVTRNVGRSKAFSLRSSNEFRTDNRSRSPFRRMLDADHDGAITQQMVAAPARLLSRDADDDQIITLADFKGDVQTMPGQLSNRRRASEPETAILIGDRNKGAYVSALQELYSFGGDVVASDWPLTPALFATLDTDGDERLDPKEAEQLATVKPHFRLRVGFGVKDSEDGPRKTSLQLDAVDPSIEIAVTAVRTFPRRISIEMAQVEVEFFVNEDPSLSNYEEVAQGQFNAFDTDSNGYLEEDELPEQLPGLNIPFAGVDADGDGKVYPAELAAFLELRQRAYRGQVRARAADQEDALFTALDTNGDGRLHAREIAATPDALAKMDRNQDGRLQSHEIPGSMVVGFVRGNPQQDNALFVLPTGEVEVDDEKLPRWFKGMDTNRDGEIGSQEFVGTPDRFATFDKNQDGFISPVELPSELLVTPTADTEPADDDQPAAEADTEKEVESATEVESALPADVAD